MGCAAAKRRKQVTGGEWRVGGVVRIVVVITGIVVDGEESGNEFNFIYILFEQCIAKLFVFIYL